MFQVGMSRAMRGFAGAGRKPRGVLAALFAFVALLMAMTPALALAAAPTVTSVSPSGGPLSGGTTVIINGSGFSTANPTGAVKFGATNATYMINSDSQITATSPANSAGTYDVTVTNPDGTSATTSADLFTYRAPPIGQSFTYGSLVTYNDGSNATLTFSVTGYVSGGTASSYAVGSTTTAQGGSVSIDNSGTVTYRAPIGYRNGNDYFTYTASNVGGTSAPATVTLTMGNPTFAVTLPSASGMIEREYNAGSASVSVTGGRASYTINSISGLPPGLTDLGGGVIGGTPTADGVYTVSVSVTDSSWGAGPYTDTASATLTVSLPPAPVASSFNATAVAYNASATTFSAASHATNIPSNYAVGSATTANGGSVTIDSAGLVTYTAPTGFRGNDSFTFRASNAGGTSSFATVTVPVSNPVFTVTLPAATGAVGVDYNAGATAVTMDGGRSAYSNFSATGLPAGLSMSSSGVISGTPTTATNATVTVTATDSSTGTGPYTTTASTSLSIAPPTITLSPAAGALPGGQAGVLYTQNLTSTGGYAPVIYYVGAGSTPPGTVVAANGILSGTPTGTGTFNFTVIAQDSSGNAYTGSAAYSVTIAAPTITVDTTSLSAGTVGAGYNETILVSGGNAPYSFNVTSGSLPAGLMLSSGGLLSGTPTAGGSFTFTITATDSTSGGTYTGSRSLTLNIGAPTISVSPGSLASGTIAVAYNASVTASGGTSGYSFGVTAGALPPGLALATNGAITGSPTGAGVYNFTITATDSSTGAGPYTGAQAYTLNIAQPTITLAPTSLSNATVGAAYSAAITASGGTLAYTYALNGTLPAGLTLSSAGVLSGTPTAGGTFTFDVTATDSSTGTNAPFTATRSYSLIVQVPTITLSPSSLTGVAAGATINQTLTASGGTAGYTYAVTAGALPAGVTLSNGVLSGAPTAAGTFSFVITTTDSSTGSGPYTGGQTYSWVIGTPTITVDTASLANGQVDQAYSETLTASGGVAPYSYTVLSGLPAGLSLSSAGVLSGTPTAAGSFNFTITATDVATGAGAPFMGSHNYTLTIGTPTLTLNPTTLTGMTVGASYTASVSAGGGTSPYTYAVTVGALPTGLSLSTAGGISGTPTAAGAFSFTITATDSTTGSGSPFSVAQAYNVTLAAPTVTLTPSSAGGFGGRRL